MASLRRASKHEVYPHHVGRSFLVSGRTRNRDLRVKAAFRVRYRTMDELVVAYSSNLSRGGLFLVTDRQPPPGSVVRLSIELPDGGPEIVVPCEVVFVRDADSETGAVAGMGLRFIDPDQVTRRRLEWFILHSAPEEHQFGAGPRASKLRILIVEDDPLQCEAAAAPFRERGDTLRVSQDGLDALASCLKQRPDVILSDVQMPRIRAASAACQNAAVHAARPHAL